MVDGDLTGNLRRMNESLGTRDHAPHGIAGRCAARILNRKKVLAMHGWFIA